MIYHAICILASIMWNVLVVFSFFLDWCFFFSFFIIIIIIIIIFGGGGGGC
jgi:hypothetical protein